MTCSTCVYGLTCRHPATTPTRGDLCLPEYKHYVEGDPRIRLLELQRSGEINIVLGGEGEHEVNSKWTIDEAYKHLDHVCNECGGLCWKEKPDTLIVDKPYGGAFTLVYVDGELHMIFKETRQIPKYVWWTNE